MKRLIFLAILWILCIAENVSEPETATFEKLKSAVEEEVRISPHGRKPLEWKPKGEDGRWFHVDRNNLDSVKKFIELSGKTYGRLLLKNFNSEERVSDVWHHRMVRGLGLNSRRIVFDYSHAAGPEKPPEPKIVLENTLDGWFPFGHVPMPANLTSSVIRIKDLSINCTDKSLSKYNRLIDKYGSFVVQLEHNCLWKYWNFDATNLGNFSLDLRSDLNFTSDNHVVFLKMKGFGRDVEWLRKQIVEPLRLDRIREVGVSDYMYENGCLRFEGTDPLAVFLFKDLAHLHFDTENFNRSAPFVIDSLGQPCLNLTKKIELFEKFGVVALRIIDECPDKRKVIILNGRQPFSYVKNREDVKFHDGDVVLYSRIRDFTSEHHLNNLEDWFHEMGYSNVKEIGDSNENPKSPEVSVTGSIAAFLPFPFLEKVNRKKPAPLAPVFFYRNNSGLDCRERGTLRTLRHAFGTDSVASSRNCECGPWTSSEFFWRHCTDYRGTLEITGSPSEKDLLRYKGIRRIRDGQLWIHDTQTVRDLSFVAALEVIECRRNQKDRRMRSAIRIEGNNAVLEEVDFPKLARTENCREWVWMGGRKGALPEYAVSHWMEKRSVFNDVTVVRDDRNCIAYYRKGGERYAAFAHNIDQCTQINGNLTVDGTVDDVNRLTHILRNVRRINGSVLIRNLKTAHCRLLQYVRFIDGNLEFENNPFLSKLPLGLTAVSGEIRFSGTPRMCWELQRMRPFVAAFQRKTLLLDCPFQQETMFEVFEERFGDVDRMSHLGICYATAFFVCYMMYSVFGAYASCMNVTRWKKWTELDARLREDTAAFLDEDSSEEEMDVVTWKRKEAMKRRLDGRDIEGEKMKAEWKEYRKRRSGPGWTEKLKAVVSSGVQKEGSGSDFSGHSWLPRKQARRAAQRKNRMLKDQRRKEMEARREEDGRDPIFVAEAGGLDREWAVPLRLQPLEPKQLEDMEAEYFAQLNLIVKNVMKNSEKVDEEYLMRVWAEMKKSGLIRETETMVDLKRLEQLVQEVHRRNLNIKTKQWEEGLVDRRRYRKRAIKEHPSGNNDGKDYLVRKAKEGEKKKRQEAEMKKKAEAATADQAKDELQLMKNKSEKKKKRDTMFMDVKVETTNFGQYEDQIEQALRTAQYESMASQMMSQGQTETVPSEALDSQRVRATRHTTYEDNDVNLGWTETFRDLTTQGTDESMINNLDASTKTMNLRTVEKGITPKHK